MNSLHSKTVLSVYSTLTFMLLHLWLNAQTPCPNLVTNGNFEAATSTGFTSGLLVNCGCVLNTHCVTTNFNLKCPSTFPTYGGYPTGTGKFLLAQNSLAANVWETNVTVTPGAPYTFSFWVAQGPFYPVTIAMRVNNVNVNQFTVNQTTPLWTQYTYSGICPAGVTSLPIAIRQISFGEAYSFGIDDVRFISCVCDCPSGSVAGSNALINGDFSGGNTGFTNNYTYFVPTTFTAIGKYSVLNMTQVFGANSQWACTGNTTGAPTDAFLVVDGASGTGQTAWQNQVPITTIVGGQYKFCFDANNLVIPARDYADPILEVWINNVKVAGPFTLPETPDVWVAITASWTATSATAVIEIRAISSEGVGNDFAIDNISFKQCVDLCTTCTGSAATNPNMIANGNFSAGDIGFGSGLISNPYTASTLCQPGYYGVRPNANLYCNIWPTLLDHTNPPTGQFMAIDGATTGTFPRVLWQNQSPITLSATKNYTFSFWWASIYPTTQQNFPVQIDILNNTGVVVASGLSPTANQVQIVQTPALTWQCSSVNWTSTVSGIYFIAIRQLTAGAFRDFAIDDICMRLADTCATDAGLDQTICSGQCTTISATGGATAIYQWSNGPTTPSQVVCPTATTTYYVTTTFPNGCVATDSVKIIVNPKPVFADGATTICSGTIVNLPTFVSNYGTIINPIWVQGNPTTGASVPNPTAVTPSVTTTYFVYGTSANGCRDTAQVVVTVNPKPNLGNDIVLLCNGFTAPTTYNFGTNAPAGFWGFISGPTTATIIPVTGIASNMTVSGVYTFFLTTNDGCKDTINLTIPFCDTCRCGSFSNILYRPSQGGASVPKVCGDTLSIACNAQFSPILSGLYNCNGQCMTSGITWELRTTPNSTPIQTGPLSTTFSLSLLAAYFTNGGFYELTLRPQCGTMMCPPCKFTLKVDSCCCQNRDVFIQHVKNVVSLTTTNNPCKATISIGNLSTCDVLQNISWGDGSTSLGPFGANTMPMHVYSGSGIYVISYLAIEKNPQGQICFELLVKDTIRLMCADSCRCGTGTLGPNLVINGNFSAGNTGFTSQLINNPNPASCLPGFYGVNSSFMAYCNIWQPFFDHTTGTGLFMAIDGASNSTGPTVLWQTQNQIALTANKSYCFSFWWASVYPATDQSFPVQIDIVTAAGTVVASSGLSPTANQVLIAQTPAPVWKQSSVNWISNLTGNYYIAIRQLTSGAFRDFGIDDICMRETVPTPTHEATLVKLNIKPNPNSGTFTVELPEAAKSGTIFRITDVSGRIIQERQAEMGTKQQTVQANALSSGLYFLQVVSDGKVLAVEKFVKQ